MTYTVICVDTGGYETRVNPDHNSVRVFAFDAESPIVAADWAQDFLLDEFPQTIGEWRIVAVLYDLQAPWSFDGKPLRVIDKTAETT